MKWRGAAAGAKEDALEGATRTRRLAAVAAVAIAALVGVCAVADAASGRGRGTDSATKVTAALAVVALAATILAVTRIARALPFAGAFAAAAWLVALAVDTDRWWMAPAGGLGVVVLLLVAAPAEVRLDDALRRRVVADRVLALSVGGVGAVAAAVIADMGGPPSVAAGAWVAMAAVVVLAAVVARVLARIAR